MKKYLVLATVFLLSSYASAANMTWYGNAGWRYGNSSESDGASITATNAGVPVSSASESTRKEVDQQFRAALGATGGWDNVEWGIGVRTQNSGDSFNSPTAGRINSDWTTTNGQDFSVGFENAWFKYGNDWGFGDVGVVVGRQAPAFARGKNQVFIDDDVRFDGLAETWQWGSFGLNFSQYVLGAVSGGTQGNGSTYVSNDFSSKLPGSGSGLTVLYSFQPTFKWKFTDDITGMFAVGYHQWSNAVGSNFDNLIPNGGNLGFAGAANPTTVGGLNNTSTWSSKLSNENAAMWQGVANFTLPFMLVADFEIIVNKQQQYGAPPSSAGSFMNNTAQPTVNEDNTAWAASLSYGAIKKAHDFFIGYTYQVKGIGSVYDRYTNDQVAAGMQGHQIRAAYNIANNFNINAEGLFLNEKNGKNQIGVDNGKNLKNTYWEVGAGVKF